MLKKRFVRGLVLATCLASTVQAETSSAPINGALYAVIAQAHVEGPIASYVRLFNGAATTSTFSLVVIGSQTGTVYGQPVSMQIPHNASIQYSLAQILALSGSPATTKSDDSYSIYIQDPDATAGYQHITYSTAAHFLEDASNCTNGLLAAATLANNANIVVTNVHTSSLGNSAFPSRIELHNYSAAAAVAKITVVDAGLLDADGSTISASAGTVVGQTNVAIPANSTVSKTLAALQEDINWVPNAGQPQANIIVSNPNGVTPTITVSHVIRNTVLGGDINMSQACAVGKPSSGASIYKGTIAGVGGQSGTIAATLQSATATAKVASASTTASTKTILEKTRALSPTSGTLLLGGNPVVLSGTTDTSTNAVNLSGSGYTFTGTVSGGIYSGTYTGPKNVVGAFSTLNTAQGVVTAYCGTYTEDRHPTGAPASTAGGVFNLQIAANGAVSGATSPTSGDGGAGTFTGQANGATVNVHHAANNKPGNDDDLIATIQNGTISGSYPVEGGLGTFSGNACELPST